MYLVRSQWEYFNNPFFMMPCPLRTALILCWRYDWPRGFLCAGNIKIRSNIMVFGVVEWQLYTISSCSQNEYHAFNANNLREYIYYQFCQFRKEKCIYILCNIKKNTYIILTNRWQDRKARFIKICINFLQLQNHMFYVFKTN